MSDTLPPIPFVDLPRQNEPILENALERVRSVLTHGQYILGPEVGELESALAAFLGVSHVVGVNSGTDALEIALEAHGIGRGDEVILPSHTFLASAAAICRVGATPVFADVDPVTMLVCPESVASKLTPRTAAIMPVHLNGSVCDLSRLTDLASRSGLVLIEDAAQSLGATRDGRKTGSVGTGCFSMHPLKVFAAAGDAGFISTSDDRLAEEFRQRRNLGLRNRDEAIYIGGNSRLDTIHAAILLAKLPFLEEWIAARRAHARAYREALAGFVTLPCDEPGVEPIYSPFVIQLNEGRDRLQKHLADRGIDSKVHYPIPVHRQPAFARYAKDVLPETDALVGRILSLPCSAELKADQRDRIIDAIQEERG